ncbi:MAG: hypothetical protein J6J62_03890 [Oscillospiraceae bacterium]|nr:hypothetical protein [Oscillospiraceae bacterium]
MENNKFASTIPACNMIIALLIFTQIPIMFGLAPANAIIYAMPWILAAFPVLLICIVVMFKNGDFVDATINAVLSGVLMGQNFVRGIISLTMLNAGTQPTADILAASAAIDTWVYLAAGIILLVGGWLAHFNSKLSAVGVWASAIGFLSLSAMYAGFGQLFGLIGAIGLVTLGVYLLYSGLAILVNTAMQKKVFPL